MTKIKCWLALLLFWIPTSISAAPLLNNIGLASKLPYVPCIKAREGSHYVILDASSTTDCDSAGGGTTAADCVCRSGVYAADSFGSIATVTPSSISGLVIWLDGQQEDANLNDGDAVGTATNYGSGGNFTQATGSKKPTFKTNIINGLPVYRLDGGDCLSSASTIGISTFDVFAVFVATGHGFVYEQSADSSANDGSGIYTDSPQSRVRRTTYSTRSTNPTGWGGNENQWHVIAQDFNGTHQTHRFWVDGSFVFTQSSSGTGPTSSTSTVTATVYVGCRNNGSFFLTGDIAELLIYSPKLSSANADRVKTYLRYKYGL